MTRNYYKIKITDMKERLTTLMSLVGLMCIVSGSKFSNFLFENIATGHYFFLVGLILSGVAMWDLYLKEKTNFQFVLLTMLIFFIVEIIATIMEIAATFV